MRYRSKKDTWIVAFLCGGLLLPVLLGIFFLLRPGILRLTGGLLLFIGIALGAFFLALMATTSYEITPATLLIRSGWLQREIALNAIEQVFPTRNPLSAPAWSLDRLQVDYRQDGQARFVLISPKDKFRFLQDLAATAEDLEVRDECVVRRH